MGLQHRVNTRRRLRVWRRITLQTTGCETLRRAGDVPASSFKHRESNGPPRDALVCMSHDWHDPASEFVQGLKYFYTFFAIGKQGIAPSESGSESEKPPAHLSIRAECFQVRGGRFGNKVATCTYFWSRTRAYNSLGPLTSTPRSAEKYSNLLRQNPERHKFSR